MASYEYILPNGEVMLSIDVPKDFALCMTHTQQIIWLYELIKDYVDDQGDLKVDVSIGSNGHWYVNGDDTGQSAVGPAGPAGEPGTPGAAGRDGRDGKDGSPGFSPTATVQEVTGGVLISITDEHGTTHATVLNGINGTNGKDGAPGAAGKDGFSPTVTATQDGDGVIITVTDATGTTTARVSASEGAKGEKGDPGPAGAPGQAATVAVGSVTTGVAGTEAQVTNSGTESAAVLNFVIPRGEAGPAGEPGAPGAAGKDGSNGADGKAATVTVGTVTTGAAGSAASVTNSGTESAAVLNFTIPRGAAGSDGAPGAAGKDGSNGADGKAATVAVGTVTTGAAGSAASVTNSGTENAAILDFVIPRGDKGEAGSGGGGGKTVIKSYDPADDVRAPYSLLGVWTANFATDANNYGAFNVGGATNTHIDVYEDGTYECTFDTTVMSATGSPAFGSYHDADNNRTFGEIYGYITPYLRDGFNPPEFRALTIDKLTAYKDGSPLNVSYKVANTDESAIYKQSLRFVAPIYNPTTLAKGDALTIKFSGTCMV